MIQPRLFTPIPLHAGATVTLPEAAAHHASRVLRLRAGDTVALFNGEGGEFHARLEAVGKSVQARVEAHLADDREAPLRVTLAQVVPAGERMDWIVQKATELGVAGIVPLQSARSVVRLAGERADKRVAHWQGVAIAACEQCGRNRLPAVEALRDLPAYLARSMDLPGRRYILAPEGELRLRGLQPLPGEAFTLLAGPEGGFEPAEAHAAQAAGWTPLSLGPRILRSDTAGLAALAALQALYGDL